MQGLDWNHKYLFLSDLLSYGIITFLSYMCFEMNVAALLNEIYKYKF
jgi:hypothetical protein